MFDPLEMVHFSGDPTYIQQCVQIVHYIALRVLLYIGSCLTEACHFMFFTLHSQIIRHGTSKSKTLYFPSVFSHHHFPSRHTSRCRIYIYIFLIYIYIIPFPNEKAHPQLKLEHCTHPNTITPLTFGGGFPLMSFWPFDTV